MPLDEKLVEAIKLFQPRDKTMRNSWTASTHLASHTRRPLQHPDNRAAFPEVRVIPVLDVAPIRDKRHRSGRHRGCLADAGNLAMVGQILCSLHDCFAKPDAATGPPAGHGR